jgi:adenine phosphoribosyltransferase
MHGNYDHHYNYRYNTPFLRNPFYSHPVCVVSVAKAKLNLDKIIGKHPDFPKPGILFRDINPVFRNPNALKFIADEFSRRFSKIKYDATAGIESRGFVVATALGMKTGKGMIMIRKAGKLPGATIKKSYDIEYGSAVMELQESAVKKNQRVLITDDLIATGGTAVAAAQLVEELGGKVAGFAFVIELADLHGADRLRDMGYKVESLVVY